MLLPRVAAAQHRFDALVSDGAGGVVCDAGAAGCLPRGAEVFGIDRLVAERARQWRQCPEDNALDDPWWPNELSLTTEFPGEERERQQPRHARALALPSLARPYRFWIMSSKRSAGRMSRSTSAVSSPTFHQSCTTPGATSTCRPAAATSSRPSTWKRTMPARTWKRSVM